MTGRNVALLERVMQHIEAHPEQHNQREWIDPDASPECGTAACFAGWAAVMTFGEGIINRDTGRFECPAPYDEMRMSEAAEAILGITQVEGYTLFTAWNTPEMLRLMVDDLVAGRALLGSPEDYEDSL